MEEGGHILAVEGCESLTVVLLIPIIKRVFLGKHRASQVCVIFHYTVDSYC